MAQTSYSQAPGIGVAGQSTEGFHEVVSALTDGTVNGYGLMVSLSAVATGNTCKEVREVTNTDTVADFEGILVYENHRESADEIADNTQVSVMRRGRIMVVPEVSISAGDDVYVRIVAAGAEVLGAFRNDADTADAIQLTTARWLRESTSGQTNILEFDLTV